MHITRSTEIGVAPSFDSFSRLPIETYWGISGADIETPTEATYYNSFFSDKHEASTNATCVTSHDDAVLFKVLVENWNEERGITSSLSEMTMCRSYLRIIAMGKNALPLILKQMKNEGDDPDHWFAALEAIAAHDPIPEEWYGDTVNMAKAWFDWADKNHAW